MPAAKPSTLRLRAFTTVVSEPEKDDADLILELQSQLTGADLGDIQDAVLWSRARIARNLRAARWSAAVEAEHDLEVSMHDHDQEG